MRQVWGARVHGWLAAEDLHLTLRFLGDLPAEQVQDCLASLPATIESAPLNIAFERIELWPTLRPRLAVATMQIEPRLADWVEHCEQWARAAGLAAETRPWVGRFTLLRSPRPLPELPKLKLAAFDVPLQAIAAFCRQDATAGTRYRQVAVRRLPLVQDED